MSNSVSLRLGHVALRVCDIVRSRAFYQEVLLMRVVWEPDENNVYLSLGRDNLALHQSGTGHSGGTSGEVTTLPLQRRPAGAVCSEWPMPPPLDHIGFIVDHKEEVDQMAERMEQRGVPIVHPVRLHRDGSYSFYVEDPDRNLIQILYIPEHVPGTGIEPVAS